MSQRHFTTNFKRVGIFPLAKLHTKEPRSCYFYKTFIRLAQNKQKALLKMTLTLASFQCKNSSVLFPVGLFVTGALERAWEKHGEQSKWIHPSLCTLTELLTSLLSSLTGWHFIITARWKSKLTFLSHFSKGCLVFFFLKLKKGEQMKSKCLMLSKLRLTRINSTWRLEKSVIKGGGGGDTTKEIWPLRPFVTGFMKPRTWAGQMHSRSVTCIDLRFMLPALLTLL